MFNLYATHAGKHHADDICASAMLRICGNLVKRFERDQVIPFSYTQFDIGHGKYDHHQMDAKVRENGIPYSSFGLLYEDFGADMLRICLPGFTQEQLDLLYVIFETNVVQLIDAQDNGVQLDSPRYNWVAPMMYSLDQLNDDDVLSEGLKSVILMVSKELSYYEAKVLVDAPRENPNILILETGLGWKKAVLEFNNSVEDSDKILYVVLPSSAPTQVTLQAVNATDEGYELLKPLPTSWLDVYPKGCKFVHKNLFMASFNTFEEAISAAKSCI